MKIFYEPVFHVETFHSFYKDNLCRALAFEPTYSCSALLNRYRLVFKGTENGFGLVGEKRNTGTDAAPVLVPFVNIPVNVNFYFFIRETRPDFLNITDADMDELSGGRKFLLRNDLTTPLAVTPTIATLTVHNNVAIADTVAVDTINFYAPVAIAENPVRLALLDANGGLVIEKMVPRDNNGNITADKVLMSKSPLAEGVYELQQIDAANAVTSSQRYFLTWPASAYNAAGILMIDYNAALLSHQDKEIRIVLQFASRGIRWVYQVEIEKYLDPTEAGFTYNPATLFLNNPGNNVPSVASVFTKTVIPAPGPLSNDKVIWRSNNLISLREEPYREVTLIDTGLTDPVFDHLPNPEPVKMKDDGSGNYAAEIFMKIK